MGNARTDGRSGNKAGGADLLSAARARIDQRTASPSKAGSQAGQDFRQALISQMGGTQAPAPPVAAPPPMAAPAAPQAAPWSATNPSDQVAYQQGLVNAFERGDIDATQWQDLSQGSMGAFQTPPPVAAPQAQPPAQPMAQPMAPTPPPSGMSRALQNLQGLGLSPTPSGQRFQNWGNPWGRGGIGGLLGNQRNRQGGWRWGG